MMETILSYGLVATILTALVQWIKIKSGVNGLIVLAGLSLAGGIVYALLVGFGLWQMVMAQVMIVLTAANTIWNVLSQIGKMLNPDDSNV